MGSQMGLIYEKCTYIPSVGYTEVAYVQRSLRNVEIQILLIAFFPPCSLFVLMNSCSCAAVLIIDLT